MGFLLHLELCMYRGTGEIDFYPNHPIVWIRFTRVINFIKPAR